MDADVRSSGIVLFDKGDRLNVSPELTAGAFADYVFPLGGSDYEGQFSASANYTSEMDLRTAVGAFGAASRRIAYGDPMTICRVGFAVQAADRWTATVFVDNVGNEQGSPVRIPFDPLLTDWNAHVRPRTYGIQFEFHLE